MCLVPRPSQTNIGLNLSGLGRPRQVPAELGAHRQRAGAFACMEFVHEARSATAMAPGCHVLAGADALDAEMRESEE